MIRASILLVLLAALAWALDREQRTGRFQKADDFFLDLLLANTRERFTAEPARLSDQVVLVRMREADHLEYSSWPPAPLDWQMVLKSLAAFEPEVVVIATPLAWPDSKAEFIPAVAEALIPFPSVVLAVEVKAGAATDPAELDWISSALPSLTRVSGDAKLLPNIGSIVAAPHETVRPQMELGLIARSADAPNSVAFAMRAGETVAPSLVLQALTRHSRAPYSQQRLVLGPGGGAHLGQGIYLPLTTGGDFIGTSAPPLSVNALDLMTGTLADALSDADKATLGKNKIIVIGIDKDGDEPTLARLQAQALTRALSLPRIRAVGVIERWIISALAALLGLLTLRHRGWKAFRLGLLIIFAALVVSFLLFQSQLIWFPPAIPATLLAASTLFAMLFGRRR